ncbi:hypothetical protein CDL15_Pgr014110 [Punica granatum]|uniref:HMA domain-containing protein n=1 Tax=Punica granatum TaxID=22663 RepID=A0A218VW61_PUNGR|nr:hypothetical protein CDL15_Pgr014110 [Punica granatum]
MAGKEAVKEKVEASVITAVYKVNLHCRQCTYEIKKPLLRTQGIHHVDFDLEKNEVKVKGEIDALKIHKKIERLSKKKVELISPKIPVKAAAETEKKVVIKETKKEVAIRTIKIKVHMHCDQCERIFSVNTDMKTQTITLQGTVEESKLLSYIQSRVNKRAQIIPPPKPPEVVAEVEKEKVIMETKTTTSVIVEFKEDKKVEIKTKEGNPYFIPYVYAPQMFSDENPNACSVM